MTEEIKTRSYTFVCSQTFLTRLQDAAWRLRISASELIRQGTTQMIENVEKSNNQAATQ